MKKFIKEFLYYGLKRNVYWAWHFLGGASYAMFHFALCREVFKDYYTGYMFLIILGLSVIWELIEFLSQGKSKIIKTYGSLKVFVYDSLGDILVALIGGLIISAL